MSTGTEDLSTGDGGSDTTTGSTGTDTDDPDTETGDPDTGTGWGECEAGCEDAVEIADGFVECPEQQINRVARGTFDPIPPGPPCIGGEDVIECSSDADCNASPHGRCIYESIYDGAFDTSYCHCAYACSTDDDCEPGSVCVPPEVLGWGAEWPKCVPASCTSNSDCGECGECSLGVVNYNCQPLWRVACRTSEDTCTGGMWECVESGGSCFPELHGPWSCHYYRC